MLVHTTLYLYGNKHLKKSKSILSASCFLFENLQLLIYKNFSTTSISEVWNVGRNCTPIKQHISNYMVQGLP